MTFSASAPQLPSYWKDWVSAALLEFAGTPTAPPTATKSAYKPVRVECAGGPSDTPPPPSVDYHSIQEFIRDFLRYERIYTATDLDNWCGRHGAKKWGNGFRRAPLYAHTKEKCPIHYAAIKHPESTIRATYEMYLTGFKIKSKSL